MNRTVGRPTKSLGLFEWAVPISGRVNSGGSAPTRITAADGFCVTMCSGLGYRTSDSISIGFTIRPLQSALVRAPRSAAARKA